MSNGKVIIVHLIAGLIKDLNHATKTDMKNISHVDTSSFALKKT